MGRTWSYPAELRQEVGTLGSEHLAELGAHTETAGVEVAVAGVALSKVSAGAESPPMIGA